MGEEHERRDALLRAMADTLGREAAETMFALLPQPNQQPAPASQVEQLSSDVSTLTGEFRVLRAQTMERFEHVEDRLDRVDGRLDRMDERFDGLATVFATKEDIQILRHELIAVFRGELVATVSLQQRHLLVAVVTAVTALAGLAWTLAQLL